MTVDEVAAFWARVAKAGDDDCWPWTVASTADGYGRLKIRHRLYSAHRVAASLALYPIPLGHVVMHKCDNPACCNPRHLVIAPQRENVRDMVRKRRGNPPVGMDHSTTKITPEIVRQVRAATGTNRAIGAQFGLSCGHVSSIRRRVIWRHVT